MPREQAEFQDPYTYPTTSVLRNRLDIRDQPTLDVAERKLTWVRRQQLHVEPLAGEFDLAHLCAIHHWLFQDLFEWAGQIRTVEISKGNSDFQPSTTIPVAAGYTFGELHRGPLISQSELSDDVVLDHCADLLERLNYMHPFREGNGRTQRAFVDQVAARHGRTFSWRNLTADENTLASVEAVRTASSSPMRALLEKALAPPQDGKTLLDDDLYAVSGPMTVYAPLSQSEQPTCLRCGRPLEARPDIERGYDARCATAGT